MGNITHDPNDPRARFSAGLVAAATGHSKQGVLDAWRTGKIGAKMPLQLPQQQQPVALPQTITTMPLPRQQQQPLLTTNPKGI